MYSDEFLSLFESIHPLSEDFKGSIKNELTPISYPKNYTLFEAPKVADYIYFLLEGFAISYTFVEKVKVVNRFWESGQLILPTTSFLEQKPSIEFIYLTLPSEVLHLSYHSLEKLCNSFPESHLIYQALLRQEHRFYSHRTHDLLQLNAQERYQKLLADHPGIEQRMAQEHIASYLGITPQSLSRIKKSIF